MSNISASLTPAFKGCNELLSINSLRAIAHAADDRKLEVSEHFSPFDVQALTLAAAAGDIAGIDAITDRLVADGLARARDDVSMLDELRAGLRLRFGRRA